MAESLHNSKMWQDAVSAGKNCLSAEELHTLLDDNGSEQSTRHVNECPHCQVELALFKSFESSERLNDNEADAAWIVGRLQAQSGRVAPSVGVSGWRTFLRLPYLAGAVAATLVVSLAISLYVFERPQRPVLTADVSRPQPLRSLMVHLVAPAGNLLETPKSFQWERFPGAVSYTVELSGVDGSILWEGKSHQEILLVGPELKAKMPPSKALAWRVTALDSSGKAMASSNLEHFIVKQVNGKK